MKNLIIALVITFAGGCIVPLSAQTNDLSPEELEMFRTEVRNRTNRFQSYLTFIGSKKNSLDIKRVYIKQALQLFIGKGEDYEDVYGNPQPAVGMETTSKQTKKKSWQTTKRYLNRLATIDYEEIEIAWVDTCRVSNFYKVKDGVYSATVTVSQRFAGYRKDGRSYIDTTVKSIDIHLEEYLTPVGKRYRILFGDIEAIETY